MADIRRVIEIDVKTSAQAVATMRQIARDTEAMEKRFSSMGEGLRGFFGTLAAGLSVGAVVQAIRATSDALDEMGKRSERLGVSTEALSALTYQAKLANVSAEQLDVAMVKLNVSLSGTDESAKASTKALEQLGVTATDPVEALGEIADKFAAMDDGAKKTALAVQLFGKSGAQMIPMLNEGADGMKRAREEADALGITVGRDAVKAAQAFNDNMSRLGATVDAVRIKAMTPFIAALADITEKFFGAGTAALSFGDRVTLAFSGDINLGKFFELRQELVKLEEELARVGQRSVWQKLLEGPDAGRRAALTTQIDILKKEIAEIERLTAIRDRVGRAQAAADTARRTGAQLAEATADAERKAREAEKAQREAERREKERVQGFVKLGADAEAAAKDISDAVAKFTGMTTTGALDALNKQLERLGELEADGAINAGIAAEARAKLTREVLRLGDAHQQLQAELEDEADAEEAALRRRDALNDAIYEGSISVEAYTRKLAALDKAEGAATESTDKSAASMLALGEAIQRSVEGWSGRATTAILDFAHGVEVSISDMATTVLREFERMAVQILIMDPIFKSFAATLKGIGWGGGTTAGVNEALGGVYASGQRLAFAAGGVVNRPTLFKFAGGTGMMGEAGPEAIMPLKRTASGKLGVEAQGGGAVTVNVINNAGADVDVRQERDANGQQIVSVVVERAMQDAIARGRFDSLMGATFGVSRRGR